MQEELRTDPPWYRVVAGAAGLTILLRASTILCAVSLRGYTRGDFWPTFLPEVTYFPFTVLLLSLGALWLGRYPPTLRRPLRTAGSLLMLAGLGTALQHLIFFELMVRIDGYEPARAREILLGSSLRIFHACLTLFLILACLVWTLRSEQARVIRDRLRAELDRRLAARAAAAVRRNVHPRFVARCLDDLADAIARGDDAERVVHRVARHLRLLQRQKGDSVRLITEMHLLGSIERLTGHRFTIELPDPLRNAVVSKGLAAACADLVAGGVSLSEPVTVHVAGIEGAVEVRLTVSARDAAFAPALRERLSRDEDLVRSTAIEQTGTTVLVTYGPAPAERETASAPVAAADPGLPMRLVPLVIILLVSARVIFVPSPYEVITISRELIGLLWLGAAPLLVRYVRRIRGRFHRSLLHALAASTVLAMAICRAAVELFGWLTGMPAEIPAETMSWIAIPRDSVMIGATIAVSALLFEHIRRNAEDRLRAIHLETSLARADVGAVEAGFHPHFLFNSLNAVLALLHGDRGAAHLMSRRLAVLFHEIVRADTVQEWTLREERALVEMYLDVMRVRFGERLQVVWRISRALDAALVPRLILQPLAENAIHHGIARRPGPGTITIAAARRGPDELSLQVENDTPGPVELPPRRRGGLTYTSERLALLYGPASAPRYSTGASTFRVDITLPFRDRLPAPAAPAPVIPSLRPQTDPAALDSAG